MKSNFFAKNIFLTIGFLGLVLLVSTFFNIIQSNHVFWLISSGLGIAIGVLGYSISLYKGIPEGIKNNNLWFNNLTNKGIAAWVLALMLTTFYIFLYWYPSLLGMGIDGNSNSGIIALFDPLSQLFSGKPASQWFVYGTLYTLAILIFGFKFILKYKHNSYQRKRTYSIIFFQFVFAWLLPEILQGLNTEKAYFGKDLKNMWPLNYYFFEDWHLNAMVEGGNLGMFFLVFGILMVLVISPFLTYYFGKRWYCSWVCGCGGLAETAGDSFRQLSDKSTEAWVFERYTIYGVLVFIFVNTALILYNYFSGENIVINFPAIVFYVLLVLMGVIPFIQSKKKMPYLDTRKLAVLFSIPVVIPLIYFLYNNQFGAITFDVYSVKKWYGFFIGAAFSGVIGVGFYPLLGSRVWCRFGCPMAGLLGLQQKYFSRFRITTNGDQCISCGNCSTYCEMGIDVKAYAQRGEDIKRASCVGCGVCSAVCPRGVLRLENGEVKVEMEIVS